MSSQDKLVNVIDNRITDWQNVNWISVETDVQKLRYAIFEASRNGGGKPLKNLQKLMLRSNANRLLAIRRVTQINRGRRTPGVDGEVVTTPKERIALFEWVREIPINEWKPLPARRVEIPKGPGKTRPLGIPTIRDRIIQSIVKSALEPEWEAKFEPTSYGFRPGRSTHDAVQNIWTTYVGRGLVGKDWILDADIKGAFDNISHKYLMGKMGYFPAKTLVQKWLEAGVMIDLELTPTSAGTPQGGIISPLLANIALDGMENALGITRCSRGQIKGNLKVVRYADDFVVMGYTRENVLEAQHIVENWLRKAGLEMSKEKTQIVNIKDGIDFLGFNIRKAKTNRKKRQVSVFIKPSKKSIRSFKEKIRNIWKDRGKSPPQLIKETNPLIRGWGNYFRIGVSYDIFSAMDNYIWEKTWKFGLYRHANKGRAWVRKKYYKTVGKHQWRFYDKKTGLSIIRMSDIGIARHVMVKGNTSPDDPELIGYWEKRRKHPPGITKTKKRFWMKQNGMCKLCNVWLGLTEEIIIDHIDKDRNNNTHRNLRLVHETCHHQRHFGKIRCISGMMA